MTDTSEEVIDNDLSNDQLAGIKGNFKDVEETDKDNEPLDGRRKKTDDGRERNSMSLIKLCSDLRGGADQKDRESRLDYIFKGYDVDHPGHGIKPIEQMKAEDAPPLILAPNIEPTAFIRNVFEETAAVVRRRRHQLNRNTTKFRRSSEDGRRENDMSIVALSMNVLSDLVHGPINRRLRIDWQPTVKQTLTRWSGSSATLANAAAGPGCSWYCTSDTRTHKSHNLHPSVKCHLQFSVSVIVLFKSQSITNRVLRFNLCGARTLQVRHLTWGRNPQFFTKTIWIQKNNPSKFNNFLSTLQRCAALFSHSLL